MLNFSQANILVVGDVMLDKYWQGSAKRISPEAPVPVVNVANEVYRAGGAANVAMNVASLGANVTLMGIVGEDENQTLLTSLLHEGGVETRWVSSSSMPTITKLRILSHHQQLIRLDFEQDTIDADVVRLGQQFAEAVAQFDLVILSDYAKGALQQVPQLIEAAKQQQVPVMVDPKGSDFSIYQSATLIKPNLSEFEAIVGAVTDDVDLVHKAKGLMAKLSLDALLVTLSERGMMLVQQEADPVHLPAHAEEVFDVTGAGDTVMATLATASACGFDLAQAAKFANQAASVVVRKVGTSAIGLAELNQAMQQASDTQIHGWFHTWDELSDMVTLAKKNGETVVMTNGCFDLLHPGHLRYLQQAKALGDRLIVAVNSDRSVSALKGSGRPINGIESRIEMLLGLSMVDWVVAFDQDTPQDLICQIKPDILVKGGDYQPEDVAGGACVQDAGGRVEILSFYEGHSTTNIVNKVLA